MKIKTGDNVKVLSGKDRGKTGKVIQILSDKHTGRVFAVVEGVRVFKKHMRSREKEKKGQVIELSAPLDISNVQLVEASSGKATRVGYSIDGTTKKRIAKKSGAVIA